VTQNTLADMEHAAERVSDGSPLLGRVLLDYFASLPACPDRFPRVVGLARRALLGHFRAWLQLSSDSTQRKMCWAK
jgi:hypothetical protein